MKTPKFTTSINVRFPPDIKQKLTTYASDRSRSEADVIRQAVYEYLNPSKNTSTYNTVIQPLDISEHSKNMEEINIVVSQMKELLERLNTVSPAAILFDNSHESQ